MPGPLHPQCRDAGAPRGARPGLRHPQPRSVQRYHQRGHVSLAARRKCWLNLDGFCLLVWKFAGELAKEANSELYAVSEHGRPTPLSYPGTTGYALGAAKTALQTRSGRRAKGAKRPPRPRPPHEVCFGPERD